MQPSKAIMSSRCVAARYNLAIHLATSAASAVSVLAGIYWDLPEAQQALLLAELGALAPAVTGVPGPVEELEAVKEELSRGGVALEGPTHRLVRELIRERGAAVAASEDLRERLSRLGELASGVAGPAPAEEYEHR